MRFKKFSWSFAFVFAFALSLLTTGCSEDNVVEIIGVCPVVVSTTPEDGDMDVPLDQVISVTFIEELNPETVNSDTFRVNGTSTVAGTVTYSESTAFFTPTDNLLPNATYTATVTTGIKDPLGNALQENYVWSFTTRPQVTTTASPQTAGTVTGAGAFNSGSMVTVDAAPNEGFAFANWTVGEKIVSTSANYQFKMDGNIALVANFVTRTYNLDVTAENGTVAKDPDMQHYEMGTAVTLTATPATGYEFSSWSGDATGSTNPLPVTMNADKNITANFTLIPVSTYTLNVTAQNGTVGKNPDQQSYNNGTSVILTATPATGYEFSSWSGDATGTNNPVSVTMNSNKNITAHFTQVNTTNIQGINLQSATDFVVLAGAGITNTGVSTRLKGDVGSFPTATIAGLDQSNVDGKLYTTADPIVDQAKKDLTSAFNDGQSRSLNAISLPGQLGGLTLAPGLYVNSTSTGISGTGPQGILTLHGDANAVWIFKIGSTLITDPGTSIVLSGGAKAENIYWIVGSSATLGTTSVFYGNILADISITLKTGATATGRALTRTGSVSLDSNTVTKL